MRIEYDGVQGLITLLNNITDQEAAFMLIRDLKRRYRFKKGAIFLADKAYDVRELYTFIVQQMKSIPYIPINPRNTKDEKTFGPHGCPLCNAGLEMKSAGTWTEGNRDRIKFRCPLKMSKKVSAEQNDICPASQRSLIQLPLRKSQSFCRSLNSFIAV